MVELNNEPLNSSSSLCFLEGCVSGAIAPSVDNQIRTSTSSHGRSKRNYPSLFITKKLACVQAEMEIKVKPYVQRVFTHAPKNALARTLEEVSDTCQLSDDVVRCSPREYTSIRPHHSRVVGATMAYP